MYEDVWDMLTDTERRYIARKKLPSPAPRPDAGKKYKPCTCGSSYWLIDYSQREKLICGDCLKIFERGEIYTDG